MGKQLSLLENDNSKKLSSLFDTEAAKRLPPNVLFGTSSWNYPGWKGLIYHRHYKSERELKQRSLEEYAAFPWFRTVGIDSTFYSPPRLDTLERYASQLPDGFPWVSKVWEEITIPHYGRHPRYGARAGKENPNFLNAELFLEQVLERYQAPGIREHTGPFVFQFQAFPKGPAVRHESFLKKLDGFLSKLPEEYSYATEIRNQEILNNDYFSILNSHKVAHCFNHWTNMSPLVEQMQHAAAAGGLEADFYITRLLTPRGVSYQEAVKRFSPYDSLKQEIPEMRADATRLIRRALKKNVRAFVLVNNRLEGNAPQTINAIGKTVVA